MSEASRPESKGPITRKLVEIPEGVQKYVPFDAEGNGEQFGLFELLKGGVSTFERRVAGKEVEGFLLRYKPGSIKVYVEKTDITPVELQKIGDLIPKVLEYFIIARFSEKLEKNIDDLQIDLNAFSHMVYTGREKPELLEKATQTLGVLLEKFKRAVPEVEAEFQRNIKHLQALGVVYIDEAVSRSAGGIHTIPVKIMFTEYDTSK